MSTKQVTIIVPNYKTYELTKVCLRLLRKNTDLNHADVIVVDNNSNDESSKYLKIYIGSNLFIGMEFQMKAGRCLMHEHWI